MKKIYFLSFFLFLTFFLRVSFSEEEIIPRRISGQVVDLGSVHPVYMMPGMVTVIEVPGEVTGIRLGNPEYVECTLPKDTKNEVTLVLKDEKAQKTNLIVRSGKRKYIFDVIPSKKVHQDTIEVMGEFGGPQLNGTKSVLLDSSEK